MPFKYFNEDGVIRGKTNNGTMNSIMVTKFGYAIGTVFGDQQSDERHLAMVCKDTRLSGYMFEGAFEAGLTAVGMDVKLTGPLPTPGAAWLTRSSRAAVGIMLTASHHPYDHNGIKFFGPSGSELTEDQKLEIEWLVDLENHGKLFAQAHRLGKAERVRETQGRYITHVKSTLPLETGFNGMRVVLDCAHGASYEVAFHILDELGAEVFNKIGNKPNGLNINEDCGAAHPQAAIQEVKKYRADLGIVLDGDGGQVVMLDERGFIIDGDQMRKVVEKFWQEKEEIPAANPANDGLVTAVQVMRIIHTRKQKASEVCFS
jgi:phosphoglucosamine mutase